MCQNYSIICIISQPGNKMLKSIYNRAISGAAQIITLEHVVRIRYSTSEQILNYGMFDDKYIQRKKKTPKGSVACLHRLHKGIQQSLGNVVVSSHQELQHYCQQLLQHQ